MTHQELYAEACRKAFEGFSIPESVFERRNHGKGCNTPGKWSKEDICKLIEYCRQGLRSQDIAPLMGRTPKAIQKAFVRFGFPRLHNICPRSGKDNPAWTGGRHVDRFGYVWVRVPKHPYANMNGYVREHRLVVEQHLGRFLDPNEVVHHKDGNRANNDIDNLEVFSSNGSHLRATLTGIPHNVSPENRKKLSRKVKKLWKSGLFHAIFHSAEYREKQRIGTTLQWKRGDYNHRDMSWVERRRKKQSRQSSDSSPESSHL